MTDEVTTAMTGAGAANETSFPLGVEPPHSRSISQLLKLKEAAPPAGLSLPLRLTMIINEAVQMKRWTRSASCPSAL